MRFDVITLFPEMFAAVREQGVCGRAQVQRRWTLVTWNPRDYTEDRHRTVDERPYGGGPGMVMMAEPLARAVDAARSARRVAGADPLGVPAPVVLFSPAGEVFHQATAQRWAASAGAILVCGRYEGVDQRFIDHCVDACVSLGDFVLSGGELAAMAVMDSVVRLLPGVLHDAESALQDSFGAQGGGLLDCPHYTRPETWGGQDVPEVLRGGDHARIAAWRREQALRRTQRLRPELIARAQARGDLDATDRVVLDGASAG